MYQVEFFSSGSNNSWKFIFGGTWPNLQ